MLGSRGRSRRLVSAALVILSLAVVPHGRAWAEEPGASVAAAYNRTGFDLFAKLAAQPGNVVISPYSVGTAMAMALVGARGDTESEMAQVLHLAAAAPVADGNRQLAARVARRGGDEDAKITVANALHLTGGPVSPAYAALLAEKFAAELFPGSDLATINAWVKQKTEGKIDGILDRLDPNSLCVILDAIYFKSSWAAPFDAKRTVASDFHLSQRETVRVPTMHRTGPYRTARAAGFDAIAMPYKGGKLAMIVLLPTQPAAAGMAAIDLDAAAAQAAIDALARAQPRQIDLSLPKFKTEFAADLIPPFQALGLTLAFSSVHADFRGIRAEAREGDLFVSQIKHKTFIDVSEAGTEAGASTAVEVAYKSIATAVRIDRPFVYLIADATSGAILFVGRVADPRK